MTETDPEKRLIGYACISTYGLMLDTQLSRAHLRRRRRSGIGRLTDPTAAAQLWLGAGSSCPFAAVVRHLRRSYTNRTVVGNLAGSCQNASASKRANRSGGRIVRRDGACTVEPISCSPAAPIRASNSIAAYSGSMWLWSWENNGSSIKP